MSTTQLEERFREELAARKLPFEAEATAIAVRITGLAFRSLELRTVKPEERSALVSAVCVRTGLEVQAVEVLVDLAMEPAFSAGVSERELWVYAGRFGAASGETVRQEEVEDLSLEDFARAHGQAEAVLLLDTLFSIAAADGLISSGELTRLLASADELEVDPMRVSQLLAMRGMDGEGRRVLNGEDKPRYSIGRSPTSDIRLPDRQVDEVHAELRWLEPGWEICKISQGRDVILNGSVVTRGRLEDGAEFRVGPYQVVYRDNALEIVNERSYDALSVRHLRRRIGEISLLDDVSFTVFSGELVALVGPSGCGKTTLLNAISAVAPADTGQVLLGSHDFHRLLARDRSLVGIVPQDDLVHAELTVDESLFYSGRVRYGAEVDDQQIRKAAGRVLEELGIEHIRESRIGDAVRRGISGGQRKRVNLGQELMSRSTRVLFLDEPTSGLDPLSAQDIVGQARQLTDRGRIVFIVTHDLSSEILAKVDHVLVLVPGGRLAFFGPVKDAKEYFQVKTLDEIFKRFSDYSPEEWGDRYRHSPVARKYVDTREHLIRGSASMGGEPSAANAQGNPPAGDSSAGSEVSEERPRSVWSHLATLTSRYFKVKMRDRTGLLVLGIQPLVLAFVMWIVFPVPTTALLFMLSLSALWFGMSAAVRELIADRVIWTRERRVGVKVPAYLGSKVLVLGLICAAQCALLAALIYFSMSLGAYEFGYWKLTGVSILTGWVGMSLGLLVSASWTSSEAAVGTLPLLLIPQITFSALMVSIRDMGPLSKALTWITTQRFAFDAAIKCGEYLETPSRIAGKWDKKPITGRVRSPAGPCDHRRCPRAGDRGTWR
ncbi:MAG: ATP-binding cassette domain-containing protein, partial [Myxococcota bacterium]|nr:ATP-binding cassette domain-containing protein [Myxococcota bacterium]